MTTRKLQNATRFQIQPRGQCFTMNCTEAMKTQREQSTHRATKSQNDVPNDTMINVSMPRKVHVTQGQTHTWTKLPWNTPDGHRSHSTTNLASPPKRRQRPNGTPHPCQVSTQRQERTTIDTNLSLTCKRYVAHRICSRCSELHPRFDQKLLTHQDFCMLLTANPASAARPDGHCRKPRLDRNDSASKVART